MLKLLKIIFLLMLISVTGCNNQSSIKIDNWPDSKSFDSEKLKKFSQQRIFFGHQSVGMNIIDGVAEYCEIIPELNANIVDFGPSPKMDEIEEFSKKNAESDTGFFAHAGVGKNGDPESKLRSFENMVDGAFKGELDYALFKFCYKDFNTNSNVSYIFSKYSEMVTRLKAKYPDLIIVHVSTPLRNQRSTNKNKIKKFIGFKDFKEFDNNAIRMKYNRLMMNKYGSTDPIFNLAKAESTKPDGTSQFCNNSESYPLCIYPPYTYDGGHLTPVGRRIAASVFLQTMINIIP